MSFWQKALKKSSAILKAALALALFVGVTYSVSLVFFYLKIDRNIYKGAFNFVTGVLVFVATFIVHKVSSSKGEPLIKVKSLRPDQTVAVVIVGLGMLGFVATYLSIVDRLAQSREAVNVAVEEYRESVDRFSDVPQVIIPVWDSVLYVLTLCLLVPVTEEMTFRGVIYGHLRRAFGPWTTVILSAVSFGIMHGLSIHIGYALACGLIIATCYHLTDSLVAPVILHLVFNVFGSGIPTLMSIEEFGIPENITKSFMVGTNTSSILFMPLSVLAIAYLVNVKRKMAKEEAAQAEMAAAVVSAEAVEDTVMPEDQDSGITGGEGSEAAL